MTTSNELLFSIFALDSYNREYGAGIEITGDANLANATVLDHTALGISAQTYAQWQADGFYAVVYQVVSGGSTVNIISYRGTDNSPNPFATEPGGSDLLNGWVLGAGSPSADQAVLAAEFYRHVEATLGPVSYVTGHSLGGGLAGFVSKLYGANAVVFDNMPFERAAHMVALLVNSATEAELAAAIDLIYPTLTEAERHNTLFVDIVRANRDFLLETYFPGQSLGAVDFPNPPANIDAYAIPGEALEWVRAFTGQVEAVTDVGTSDTAYNQSIAGSAVLHAMNLLTLKLYAQQNGFNSAWETVLQRELIEAHNNDDVARAAGFTEADDLGRYTPAGKLSTMIAYSVLEGGWLLGGNSAAHGMFDDISALATRISAAPSLFEGVDSAIFGSEVDIDSLRQGIVEAVVQHAGQVARLQVLSQDHEDALLGIVHFANAGALTPGYEQAIADTVFVDLSPITWHMGVTNTAAGSNLPDLLTGWLETLLASQFKNHPVGGVGPNALPYDTAAIEDSNLFGMFYSVYDAPDEGRRWTDARSPGQYLNGVAFLDPAASGTVTLVDFQTELGTTTGNAAVMVVATTEGDSIQGSSGNEVILSGLGNDTVNGGDGADIIIGGVGDDSINGEGGDDLLVGDIAPLGSLDMAGADEGNDRLDMGTGFDTAIGGGGNDTILGAKDINHATDKSLGHSDIHAGLGSDSVDAGDGADRIFDNGATLPWTITDQATAIEIYAMAYDGEGNDTIHGGKGSDFIMTSGGNDLVYGGQGDDAYGITGWAAVSTEATDYLEIHVADTAAEAQQGFGHDMIFGSGQGIDKLVFDGISTTDIQVFYHFESHNTGMIAWDFDPLFPWHTFDPGRQEIEQFETIGSLEIRVMSGTAAGSSVTIQQVFGSYNLAGPGAIQSSGAISTPFLLQFANGYLDLTTKLIQQGTNASTFFLDSALSATALVAPQSFETERNQVEDTITGSDGGGSGARSMTIVDTVTGNDVLSGSNAANLLRGLAGNDTLYGLHGNDWLEGGLGGDFLYGGDGSDTATYEQSTQAVQVSVSNSLYGGNTGGDAQGDILNGIENLAGSAFGDLLAGDTYDNVLRGGGGNDSVYGGVGNDSLYGGDGNDVIEARWNRDYQRSLIDGGNGNDTIMSNGGNDTVMGGAGADEITVVATDISYFPATYRWGATSLDGGLGTDILIVGTFGTGAGAVIDMVAGRFVIQNHTGGYGVNMGAESTFAGFENITTGGGNEIIYGDAQANVLRAGAGNDILYGGGGNDTLWGEGGTNEIFGGVGTDTARISANVADVTFSFTEGGIRGVQSNGDVFLIFKDVETIQFNDATRTYAQIAGPLQTAFDVIDDNIRLAESVTSDINLLANDLPFNGQAIQMLQVNGAAVTVGQVIRLTSGATVEVLANGQLRFDQAGAFAWLDAGETATETLTYTATDPTGVQRTASLNIVVDGADSAPNQFHSTTGAIIASSNLTETSAIRVANFDIGRGFVVINETVVDPNALPSGVTVTEAGGNTYLTFGDDAVILMDISLAAWQFRSAQRLSGGAGNNLFTGTAADEAYMAGAGNDTVNGNGGHDVLAGGDGNDSLILGAGGGMAFGETGRDTLTGGSGNDTLFGNADNDTVYGGSDGADDIYGGAGADSLLGGSGDDTLTGGDGNDTLVGGAGIDRFFGGAGTDLVELQYDLGATTAPDIFVDLSTGRLFWNNVFADEVLISIESVNSAGGNDTLLGNDFDNWLDGVGGNDSLVGGAGNDTLTDGYGNDTLFGGAGDDYFVDQVGTNVLYGGDGNDTLSVFGSSGIIDGGAGIDTIRLNSGFGGVALNINLQTGLMGSQIITGFENAIGTLGDNLITGTAGANLLDGSSGNDTLIGGAGNDTLIGGVGTSDTAVFTGVRSDYTFTSDNGILTAISAIDGADVIQSGIEYLSFADGLRTYAQIVASVATVDGTEGNDLINSSYVDPQGDSPKNNGLGDTIYGFGGDDTILGYAGNDTMFGGAGNDSLDGGADSDRLVGGTGNDLYIVDNGGDTVEELVGEGTDLVRSSVTFTLSDNVENLELTTALVLSGTGNAQANLITGNTASNVLSGLAGNDSLFGGLGTDTLDGGTGVDSLLGGAANDTYVVEDGGDVIVELVGEGTDLVQAHVSYALVAEVENLTLMGSAAINASGNSAANVLIGNGGDNLLSGLAGNDTLTAGDGNDTLDGGLGVDSMTGGLGDDVYLVDDASDKVVEATSAGTDTVQTTLAYTLGSYMENLVLTGSANVNGTGNTLANVLSGNSGNNSLSGGTGNDTLLGGAGNDTLQGDAGTDSLTGGLGDDLYIVDVTGDLVVEVAGEGNDSVQSAVAFTLDAALEHLELTGTAAVSATGNAGANRLTGNTGANLLSGMDGVDSLFGGAGNDTLDGGTGVDSLTGGAGNDVYILDAAGEVVIELAGEGTDLVQTALAYTLLAGFENLTLTGTASVAGTGNALANILTDNTGANLLMGLDGNDSLIASDGNDTLDGGLGTDSMIGGVGDDLYIVDATTDVVVEAAAAGNDTVQSAVTYTLTTNVATLILTGSALIDGTGNTLDNVITGNGSANLLSGGAGNDTLTGGGGNDTLVVDSTGDLLIETAVGGTDLVQSSVDWTLGTDFENLLLTGTAGIVGTGNAVANILTGNTGANALSGAAGNDTLDGAAGNDTLDGGLGTDSLIGGAGNDTFVVDVATDLIVELAAGGTDVVQASLTWTLGAELENLTLTGIAANNGTGNTVANLLTGNTGANLLSGLDGNDTLIASDGNDALDGGLGTDSMIGGLGDDLYLVDAVTDVVVEAAAAGSDTVQSAVTYTLATNVESLILTGSAIIDGTGNTLDNVITGNVAANLLSGGTGNDTITGGGGNDTLVADSIGDVLIEAAAGGTDLVQASVVWTLGVEFENLTLTGTAGIAGTGNAVANFLTGNTGNNLLSGAAGNDTLDGGTGADTLDGGLGNDSLIGGAGNDTFIVDVATDVLVELAAGGTDLVQSGLTWALGAELENLTLTGSAAINGTGNTAANILTGNTGNNALYGGTGNDTLDGGAGNDTLDGGAGNDSMIGGAGDDVFIVDATTDIVSEAASGGTDTVQAAAAFTLELNIEQLVLTGTAAINGTGNALANVITGNSGANLLSGSTGNDTLIGNDGNDTLDGGGGNDSMTGGAGNDGYVVDSTVDAVVEAAAGGTDTVTSSIAYTLAANVENLILSGTAGNAGTGNTLANSLTGNTGANALSGLDGSDILIGAGGNDALNGGIGSDQFVFTSTTSGIDVIADFNELDGGSEEGDVLRFDGLKVGTFVYLGTSAFSGGSDNSEARVVGNQVLFDANGDGTADITITLTGLTAASQLAATDFLFV